MADNASAYSTDLDTLFNELVRAETRLYNAVAERMKAHAGVGAGHFELLRYVRDHPGSRVADLASAFAIGVGTTSKIADRLETEGWLERRPNPTNRRSSLLVLTNAGQSTVSRAEPVWQAALQQILGEGALSPGELVALSKALATLRWDLERRREGLPTG
ncbi:MarR family winged helix-turn-helix transcriptional regulator [Mycolicibacterium mengxianglii]|uniref:MarR family winged helix-turn-helix transcriptional regulator n=1 Tax=Mycolicibacterium mengxianglii TaxID=2736649 RepID=UPI0018D0F691|nr:MarR family winged helix-turn-helix transcriptional regulator [Mycolicibacterium mengxianglii]